MCCCFVFFPSAQRRLTHRCDYVGCPLDGVEQRSGTCWLPYVSKRKRKKERKTERRKESFQLRISAPDICANNFCLFGLPIPFFLFSFFFLIGTPTRSVPDFINSVKRVQLRQRAGDRQSCQSEGLMSRGNRAAPRVEVTGAVQAHKWITAIQLLPRWP